MILHTCSLHKPVQWITRNCEAVLPWKGITPPGGGGVLPYMGYIVMCRCEGYGFQAVYSRIGYIISERLGLQKGIIFQETDQLVEYFI